MKPSSWYAGSDLANLTVEEKKLLCLASTHVGWGGKIHLTDLKLRHKKIVSGCVCS